MIEEMKTKFKAGEACNLTEPDRFQEELENGKIIEIFHKNGNLRLKKGEVESICYDKITKTVSLGVILVYILSILR